MLPLNLILGFVLVLTRISALMGTAPVLNSKSIPIHIKATLAFAISFVAFSASGLPSPQPAQPGAACAAQRRLHHRQANCGGDQ